MTTAGVILAAGVGRRFGGAKQLARFEGEPLIRRACLTALAAELSPVVVVLGAHADAVHDVIRDLPVHVVHNEQWADGMGTSIACGIRALDTICDDVALLLADQPLVTADHLRALCDLRGTAAADIAATDSGDAIGVPAVFARSLLPALAALGGDRGARDLIARTERRVSLRLLDAAHDVDTPAALAALDTARAIPDHREPCHATSPEHSSRS